MAEALIKRIPLSRDEARALFVYDAEIGILRYRARPSRNSARRPGDVAGFPNNGRWKISIKGYPYLRSRVVWLYHHEDPADAEVDHADRDPMNDRIENLRLAGRSQQNCNRNLMSHNSCGHRSIYYDAKKRLWSVRISIFGTRKRFGMYKTKDEAAAVATRVGREAYGEFWVD